ncbi:hypothetical protein D9M71_618480 [compost metagenome]
MIGDVFLLAWGALDIARERLFKKVVGYFRWATRPCVVAYGYARIRRLVRPAPGLYRFRATAHQWSGLAARDNLAVRASVMQVFHYLYLMVAVRGAPSGAPDC